MNNYTDIINNIIKKGELVNIAKNNFERAAEKLHGHEVVWAKGKLQGRICFIQDIIIHNKVIHFNVKTMKKDGQGFLQTWDTWRSGFWPIDYFII